MNDSLYLAFRTIANYCRAHYRENARCRDCEMVGWCENRDGFPKDFCRVKR
ncbi:MAG TPA: hypothetical protein O0X50_00260 [Methanocorpusculum sp.]|nr:hypothetical protein [Methanocorpusculum sp.]